MIKTSYSALIAGIQTEPGEQARAHIPADWLQGRTAYGGLSAALCHAVAHDHGRGMPLRSAQIAFVGPTGGDVTLQAETLRAGKSSTYVGVDLAGEAGLATRAIFVFGQTRPDSAVNIPAQLTAPEAPAPGTTPRMIPEGVGPAFLTNFEIELISGAAPMSGASETNNLYWLGHRDADARKDMTALLALADAPPPVALGLSARPTQLSSMNWSIDILCEEVPQSSHWFLAQATAQSAQGGYSSQSMRLWAKDGTPIMACRQTIAIF